MKTKQHAITLFILLGLMNCTDESLDSNSSVNQYTNVSEGNYWIYEERVNGGNNVFYDTVRVQGQEEFNGKCYLVLTGHTIGTKYAERLLVRDSADCLVNKHGTILITTQTGNIPLQTINKSEYSISTSVVQEHEVDLGGMQYQDVLNRKENIFSRIAANQSFVNDNQYAKGVGLVRATRISWPTNEVNVRKLIKYGKN